MQPYASDLVSMAGMVPHVLLMVVIVWHVLRICVEQGVTPTCIMRPPLGPSRVTWPLSGCLSRQQSCCTACNTISTLLPLMPMCVCTDAFVVMY